MSNKRLISLMAGLALAVASASASAVVKIQLGAALDGSGSIGNADFTLQKAGWAAAVASLPADNTVEVTFVRFESGATTVIPPTVVGPGNQAALVTAIGAIAYNGGGTSIAAGINELTSAMTGSANFLGATTFANLSTDGQSDITAAVAAATAMEAAGVGSLTVEGVGGGVDTTGLLRTVFSNGAGCSVDSACGVLLGTNSVPPNPITQAWVLPVTNFGAYGTAIQQKVDVIPEPESLALLAIGLVGFGASSLRKRRVA